MHLNKRYTAVFWILGLCALGACHGTVKEYTVVREKARAVGPVENDMVSVTVPLLDGQGNLVQNATIIQQNGRPVFARLTEVKTSAAGQAATTGQQLSPVTGMPIAGLNETQNMPVGMADVPQPRGAVNTPEQQRPLEREQQLAVPGQNGYTGQVPFPLTAQQAPVQAPMKQSQVQAQLGMPPSPMQSNIVASYESCPYIVVLQHPVERTIVKCLLCDKVCIARFEQNGFVQVRYLPQASGAVQATPSDYPGGKWPSDENIPRW